MLEVKDGLIFVKTTIRSIRRRLKRREKLSNGDIRVFKAEKRGLKLCAYCSYIQTSLSTSLFKKK